MKSLQLILINYYCCWGLILQQAFVLESSWKDTGPSWPFFSLVWFMPGRVPMTSVCVDCSGIRWSHWLQSKGNVRSITASAGHLLSVV